MRLFPCVADMPTCVQDDKIGITLRKCKTPNETPLLHGDEKSTTANDNNKTCFEGTASQCLEHRKNTLMEKHGNIEVWATTILLLQWDNSLPGAKAEQVRLVASDCHAESLHDIGELVDLTVDLVDPVGLFNEPLHDSVAAPRLSVGLALRRIAFAKGAVAVAKATL